MWGGVDQKETDVHIGPSALVEVSARGIDLNTPMAVDLNLWRYVAMRKSFL